jgi:hypothetical protein
VADSSVWSAVEAIAGAVTAAASVVGLGFAFRTVKLSLTGAGMQRQLKELEKRESLYRRLVLDPAHTELTQFDVRLTTTIEGFFETTSQTSIYDTLPEAVSAAIGVEAQRNIILLRERFRFFELSFGVGDGSLWPAVSRCLNDLEDALLNLLDQAGSRVVQPLELTRLVRDAVAQTLKELTLYDLRAHTISDPIRGSFKPTWEKRAPPRGDG